MNEPRTMSHWTPPEDIELRRLNSNGWTIEDIANAFGRSPRGIESRLDKLKLKPVARYKRNRHAKPANPCAFMVPAIKTEDPGHVAKVLAHGGFDRLNLTWNEPRRPLRRAA